MSAIVKEGGGGQPTTNSRDGFQNWRGMNFFYLQLEQIQNALTSIHSNQLPCIRLPNGTSYIAQRIFPDIDFFSIWFSFKFQVFQIHVKNPEDPREPPKSFTFDQVFLGQNFGLFLFLFLTVVSSRSCRFTTGTARKPPSSRRPHSQSSIPSCRCLRALHSSRPSPAAARIS